MIVGSRELDFAAWTANGVAFAVVGYAILRTPDDEWELPPVRTS